MIIWPDTEHCHGANEFNSLQSLLVSDQGPPMKRCEMVLLVPELTLFLKS